MALPLRYSFVPYLVNPVSTAFVTKQGGSWHMLPPSNQILPNGWVPDVRYIDVSDIRLSMFQRGISRNQGGGGKVPEGAEITFRMRVTFYEISQEVMWRWDTVTMDIWEATTSDAVIGFELGRPGLVFDLGAPRMLRAVEVLCDSPSTAALALSNPAHEWLMWENGVVRYF